MKGCHLCLICLEGLGPPEVEGGNKKNVNEFLLSYLLNGGGGVRPWRNHLGNFDFLLKLTGVVKGEEEDDCTSWRKGISLRLCDRCEGVAAKVLELHLELEKIQMKIVEEVRRVRGWVLGSSGWLGGCEEDGKEVGAAYETFCKKFGNDDGEENNCSGEGMREVFEAVKEFQQAVYKADQNSVHIPLVYLESFGVVGSSQNPVVSPEVDTSESISISVKEEREEYAWQEGEEDQSFLPDSSPPPPHSTEDYQSKSDQDQGRVKVARKYRKRKPVVSPKNVGNVTSGKKEKPLGKLRSRRGRHSLRLKGSSPPPSSDEDEDIEYQSSDEDWAPPEKIMHKTTLTSGSSDSEEEPNESLISSGVNPLPDSVQTGLRVPKLEKRKRYRCEMCDFRVKSVSPGALEGHLRSHETDLKQFQCDQCAQAFSTEQHHLFHQQQHNGEYKLECDVCSEHVSPFDLLTHLKSHKEEDVDPEGIVQCGHCSHWSSSWEKRRRHVVHLHPGMALKCDVCGETFSSRKEIDKHFHLHPSHPIQFRCEFEGCGKGFTSKGSLTLHLKGHTGAFACKECGKKMSNEKSLEKHQLTHVPVEERDRPFRCDQCTKAFLTEQSLAGHMIREHGADKPKCDQCGKECISKAALRTHRRIEHADEDKALKCTLCDRNFENRHSLRNHMEGHDGEMKYICEVCGKAFSVHKSYQAHKKSHGEKKFKCPECPIAFPMKQRLKEHMRKHTGEKPFVCEKCGKAFSQGGTLWRHRKSCQPNFEQGKVEVEIPEEPCGIAQGRSKVGGTKGDESPILLMY